mmetsp:Transcript_9092/g.23797  ORF Transcript_9092/g.23797 Transcript_9092/m.23797 type:complete len:252 (-) Transcript_9092:50-805(-)
MESALSRFRIRSPISSVRIRSPDSSVPKHGSRVYHIMLSSSFTFSRRAVIIMSSFLTRIQSATSTLELICATHSSHLIFLPSSRPATSVPAFSSVLSPISLSSLTKSTSPVSFGSHQFASKPLNTFLASCSQPPLLSSEQAAITASRNSPTGAHPFSVPFVLINSTNSTWVTAGLCAKSPIASCFVKTDSPSTVISAKKSPAVAFLCGTVAMAPVPLLSSFEKTAPTLAFQSAGKSAGCAGAAVLPAQPIP